MMRSCMFVIAVLLALSTPSLCSAQDDGPGLFQYGFRGFWTGAEVGFAAGYLATGSEFESGEWRTLVLGAGIGALVGVGGGIGLAMYDASDRRRPRYGWYVLRDMGYGVLLGGLTGAAVGALVWVANEDDGSGKDVLIGLSIGVLIGAGVGIAFGMVEGMGEESARASPARHAGGSVRLTLVAFPQKGRVPALGPGLVGRF